MEVVIVVIVLIIAGVAISRHLATKRRRARLLDRYGNLQIVEDIMAKKVWQGMTKEQLLESWGQPADQGQKVMKTKTTTTYKYNQTGRNRFRSRVTLENDVVVGWQQK
jgi:hypothetical protein